MTRPLPPAIDAGAQLREAGFALLLRHHRPIDVSELSAATGLAADATSAAVAALGEAGWLDLAEGRVTGAAGLSLSTGAHSLTLGHAQFRTWCAYDALGIAAALGADSLVETACGYCGAPISVRIHAGVPERTEPEQLWLAEGGADLRGSFCTPTVLLCGAEHGSAWAQAQGGRGQLLDLAEAARRGAQDWADCASAAARLGR